MSIWQHQAALDGNELADVHESIVITGIEDGTPKSSISAMGYGGRDGQRVTEDRRDFLDIKIRFLLKIRKWEMKKREQVFEAVKDWARRGGWLTINYKEDRRIKVMLAEFPGIGDPWEWTHEYEITFRAYDVPYWQSTATQAARSYGIQEGDIRILPEGNTETRLDFEYQNLSGGTVNVIDITTAKSRMRFEGLGLANGESFIITRDDRDILQVTAGGRSALKNRTEYTDSSGRTRPSSDDLTADPGAQIVHVYAGGEGRVEIKSRGRYL